MWRPVIQRGMFPLEIVELNIGIAALANVLHGFVIFQINVLPFDAPEESFDDDVVGPSAHGIHRNPNGLFRKNSREIAARKLTPLIRIENSGKRESI